MKSCACFGLGLVSGFFVFTGYLMIETNREVLQKQRLKGNCFGAGLTLIDFKPFFANIRVQPLFPLAENGKFQIPSHIKRYWS